MKENILVIFGGVSCEHDISIISAIQAINNLDKNFYNIIPAYITKSGLMITGNKLLELSSYANFNYSKTKRVSLVVGSRNIYIKKVFGFHKWKKIDSALVIMHGLNGEDGKIMSLLSLCNIPFSAPDTISSGVCMDKCIFKEFVKGIKINTIESLTIFDYDYKNNPEKIIKDIKQNVGFPCIVKPALLGSSIGIKVCKNKEELLSGLTFGFSFNQKVLVEKFINNLTEVNVAILGHDNKLVVSELEQPVKNTDILSFENKYLNDSVGSMETLKRIMPAQISTKQKDEIISFATTIFKTLGLKGVVRFDFIIDNDENKIYVNEVNTIPGSLAFYLFKPLNINYSQLLNKLIAQSYIVYDHEKNKIKTFNSSVLTKTDGIKGIKK